MTQNTQDKHEGVIDSPDGYIDTQVTGEGTAPRKATVMQSRDPYFRMWAVIFPDRPTQWFRSENQAHFVADDYNTMNKNIQTEVMAHKNLIGQTELEKAKMQRDYLLSELKLVQSQICAGRDIFAVLAIIRAAIENVNRY